MGQNHGKFELIKIKKFNYSSGLTKSFKKSSEYIDFENAKSFRSIPGPISLPIVKNLFSLKKFGGDLDLKFPDLYIKLQKKYGKFAKFSVFTKPEIYVFDPEIAEQVFKNNDENPIKKPIDPWKKYFDEKKKPMSLSNSLESRWRILRTSINPMLGKPQNIMSYIPEQSRIVEDVVKLIESKMDDSNSTIIDNFDLTLKYLAFEWISQTSFGKKIDCIDDNKRTKESEEFIKSMNKLVVTTSELMNSVPIWKVIRTSRWKKYVQNADLFFKHIDIHINQKLNCMKDGKFDDTMSIIEHLFRFSERYNLSDNDISSMIAELFTGGIDTPASAIHFCLYELSTRKYIQDELSQEIEENMKNHDEFNKDIFNNLKLLKSFVKEVLRFHPVVIILGREATKDMVIENYKIPKGTFINISSYALGHNNDYFENHDLFDHHRWIKSEKKKIHPFATLPFGFGSRNCVARRYAEQEIYIFLIKILKKFEIEYLGDKFEYTNTAIVSPDKPLKLKFKKKGSA